MSERSKEDTTTEAILSFLARGGMRPRFAEEALRRSGEMYRNLIEQIPATVYIGDATLESDRCYISPQVEAVTGYSPEEWCVKPSLWRQRIHPDDRKEVLLTLDRALEARTSFYTEYRLYKKNGDLIWIRDRGEVVLDERGEIRFFQGLMIDITAEKDLENKKMLSGQKLESLGVLAGGIAHDFNNILTSILGYASMAIAQKGETANEMVRQIERAAQQGSDLTRQLLAYAGKGRVTLKPINLNELVLDMTQLLKMAISQKGSLVHELERDLPAIEADAAQIQQLVMNVLTNASDALADRTGTISIRTRSVTVDLEFTVKERLNPGVREGAYVMLEVSDTGVGMPEETRSKMFDPFYTTKPHGRGLGLAAVMGIVEGHHGMVQVRSAPGEGTTIRAYFPASTARVSSLGGETVESVWQGSGSILLVDDDEGVRHVAKPMLERAGFTVLSASDGQESIDTFQANTTEIVAVLMDMKMPNKDGLSAGRELKRLKPDIPIIMMSGFYDHDFANQFADVPLAGFIQKPFRARELTAKLQEALEEEPAL